MSCAIRVGDWSTGHGCFPPQQALDGSPDVLVDGLPVVVLGSHWSTHRCGKTSHDGVSVEGSSTVFVNGKPKVRQGDLISCGSHAGLGSTTVISG